MDQIPGDDRIHSFPAMAVDTTPGTHGGWIYIVYAGNDRKDGGDIHFVKSTDAGVSFSAPVKLNARPGSDRSQWFPYIAVASTGRVYATWYDQQFVSSGDVTETLMTYSDDGGVTWSRPAAITDRPFRAGFGNDTGQPNIGDYIGATTNGGNLYAAWAGTAPTILFTDGQPDPAGRFTVPDLYFAKTSTAKAALKQGTISSAEVAGFSNGNGNIDPGERINVTIPLTNFVTNATVGAASYIGVSGTLTSSTAGVSIVTGTQAYGTVAAGATAAAAGPYVIQLAGGFVPGTRIDLSLAVTTSGGGSTTLRFRLDTGTPVAATVFSEDFNGVAPGTLPAGWTTIHQGGTNTVPWTTSNSFCGTASNALFHVEANDAADPTRFERVASPNILLPNPAGLSYVTVEFDICYNTEDDPDFNYLAYDGATLRITDFTAGRTARAALLEAYSAPLTTGAINHFPKHLPRSSDPNYFQDMSVWAGASGGFKHVFARVFGMQGSTVQLRPDYTQDGSGICTDAGHAPPCGVMIDNFVVKSVTFNAALVDLSIPIATATPGTVAPGNNVTYNFTVAASNSGFNAANVVLTDPIPRRLRVEARPTPLTTPSPTPRR